METKTEFKCGPTRRKSTTKPVKVCPKEERNASLKKISVILQKPEEERTLEEQQTLGEYSDIVSDLKLRWHRRDEAKRRMEEVEEPTDVLQEKCLALAKVIANSEHLVIYTGAGISTAARIPDYRGTNGIWTRLQQGKEIGNHDLSLAEPTFTHMALSELYSRNILKYIVSQNCDGLHLRSGLPRTALSELHGNMYIEVCKTCKPAREYWRLFDVTENTARFSHKTMRRCYVCSQELVDTIVHFGERGTLQWPLNWNGACKNADKADTILCLGSSLKVLKRYPWLWQMNKPAKKRPNLYIVNLQWTPKDDCAVMKINGKCDNIMKMVMTYLGVDVPKYDREKDPIFAHATLLLESEMHTTSQPFLKSENELCANVSKNIKIESDDEILTSSDNRATENIKSEIKEPIIENESGNIENTINEKENSCNESEIKHDINNFNRDISKIDNINNDVSNYTINKENFSNKFHLNYMVNLINTETVTKENIHKEIYNSNIKNENACNENQINKELDILINTNNSRAEIKNPANKKVECSKFQENYKLNFKYNNKEKNNTCNGLINSTIKNENVYTEIKLNCESKMCNDEIVKSNSVNNKINTYTVLKNEVLHSEIALNYKLNTINKKIATTGSINRNVSNNLTQNMYYEEQIEAIDFSKQNKTNDKLKGSNNCDINTHSSIKASRLTLTNGSSSSNCTLSESTSLTKRKSQDCTENNSCAAKPSNNSIFSIDSILNKPESINFLKSDRKNEQRMQIFDGNRQINNNFQTLMAYYELANSVLQNQMLGYNIYPFQTSLLYPGLHSIINPVPFTNYDFKCSDSLNSVPINISTNSVPNKESQIIKSPTCIFCYKYFNSFTCLYYSCTEAKFINELYRFSKKENCNKLLVCVCCDYTTDEDDESDESESKNKIIIKNSTNESDMDVCVKDEEISSECMENIDQTNIEYNTKKIDGKNAKIQAGWFGKGYRKNRRVKKR